MNKMYANLKSAVLDRRTLVTEPFGKYPWTLHYQVHKCSPYLIHLDE